MIAGSGKDETTPENDLSTLGSLSVIGISYRTASLDIRSQLSFSGSRLNEILELLSAAGVRQCLVLSTCNRTEIYFVGSHEEFVFRTLAERSGLDQDTLLDHAYLLKGEETVRHLFRVACGLDSAALGETEILAQLKEAFNVASESGHLCGVLHLLFRRALNVSKRVRTDTDLCRNVTSVASMAVRQAAKACGGLKGRSILLLGAGAIAERLAKEISNLPGVSCMVVNRTLSNARALASRYGFSFAGLNGLALALDSHAVVFCAVSSTSPVLTSELVGNRALTIVDLGVPSVVEDRVADRCTVVNMEFLASACAANSDLRLGAISKAEEIIDSELGEFAKECSARDVAPAINGLSSLAEHVRKKNLEWAMANLEGISEEHRKVVEDLALRLMRGVLHGQIAAMKSESLTLQERACLSSVFRELGPEAVPH